MKRIFLLLMTILVFTACDQSEDSFSKEFLLDHTGSLIVPLDGSVAAPFWDSETTFWTAYEYESRTLIKMDLDGNILDRITLYLYPDAPTRLYDPYVSSDGSTLVFTAESGNSDVRDVCRLVPGSNDHSLFTFDGVGNVRLPNLSDLQISSPVYPWTDKLGYLGTKFDYSTMKGTQNYYIHDFSTGNTQSFALGVYGFDWEGNIAGDYYYGPDVYADPYYPNEVNLIMFCVRLETEGDPVYTVKMFSSDGEIQYDGSDEFEFEDIGAIRWLDENSLIMTVREKDTWKIIHAGNKDDQAFSKVLYESQDEIYKLSSLSLSPSKNRCLTYIKKDEYGGGGEVLVVDLF